MYADECAMATRTLGSDLARFNNKMLYQKPSYEYYDVFRGASAAQLFAQLAAQLSSAFAGGVKSCATKRDSPRCIR